MFRIVPPYILWFLLWVTLTTLCTLFTCMMFGSTPVVVVIGTVFFGLMLAFIPFIPYLTGNANR